MGLWSDKKDSKKREGKSTFSRDILRLEISGPLQEHLSVIDVPGMFKCAKDGYSTAADITLVREMVKEYMGNPRSIILAVVTANNDIATQEILQLVTEFDPEGDRTLGVLTKPDLVDKGTECDIIDIVEGRERPMKLGWHITRNPGQLDIKKSSIDRSKLETEFLRDNAPWNDLEPEKVGVDSLRIRLKEVLSSLVKREFPKVSDQVIWLGKASFFHTDSCSR
jgi:hypothetical protein